MKELRVFAEKKYHQRLKYVLDFLTGKLTEIKWKISDSPAELPNAFLVYSEKISTQACIRITPGNFLEKGFLGSTIDPKFSQIDGSIWKKDGGVYTCTFDMPGHVFFFLSRMEEYNRDVVSGPQNRFSAKESVLYQSGLIDFPIVDFWQNSFLEVLKKVMPDLKVHEKDFQWELTCDVDLLFAFKGKGLLRNLAGLSRDLFFLKIKEFALRWNWLFSGGEDPFDQLGKLIELTNSEVTPLKTFILCPSSGDFQEDRTGFQFLKNHHDFFSKYGDLIKPGLHPSLGSNLNLDRLFQEKKQLEKFSGCQIKQSRQHYLALDIPTTYYNLLAVGIEEDYSMAFHDHIGFRAGTSLPFFWYDIENEVPTKLKVQPFCLMDVSLKKYMRLSPDRALEQAKKMIENLKAVNGNFLYLWHNSSLSDLDGWSAWSSFPSDLSDFAKNDKS